MSKLSELESKLEKYRDKLEFIQEPDRLVIRTTKYIHVKSEWDDMDTIIRAEGGRYIAKDKGGPEWRVPSSSEVAKPQSSEEKPEDAHARVKEMLDTVIPILQEMRQALS